MEEIKTTLTYPLKEYFILFNGVIVAEIKAAGILKEFIDENYSFFIKEGGENKIVAIFSKDYSFVNKDFLSCNI